MHSSSTRGARRSSRRVHRDIARQAAHMWAQFERTGLPAPAAQYPAVADLYEHALNAVRSSRAARAPRSFMYHGVTYKLQWTNLGRLRVMSPETGELIVAGPPFALW